MRQPNHRRIQKGIKYEPGKLRKYNIEFNREWCKKMMKKISKKICTLPLREIAVLADGRITSCCVDRKGANAFASIYEDDFAHTFSHQFKTFKQKFVQNIFNFPTCVKCFWLRRNYYNEFHKKNPSPQEISTFLDENTVPKNFVIEMAAFCNLKCGRYISGSKKLKKYRQSKLIDAHNLRKWLLPGINNIKSVRLYNYGETLLHPQAIDTCSFLTKNNPSIYISIATNLLPLNTPQKVEQLIRVQPNMLVVSLHGANQDTVKKFMGDNANFQLVLNTMENITKRRNELGLDLPVILWKYLLLKTNDTDEQMLTAQSTAAKNGIDFLEFDIAAGRFASKRFYKGGKDFEELKKSKYYIQNVVQKIAKQGFKRKTLY
jgi:hypothetical protein